MNYDCTIVVVLYMVHCFEIIFYMYLWLFCIWIFNINFVLIFIYMRWWIMMVVGGDVWSIASMDEQRDFPTFALFHIFIFPMYNIQSSLLLQNLFSYFPQYSKLIAIVMTNFRAPLRRWLRGRLAAGFAMTVRFYTFQHFSNVII